MKKSIIALDVGGTKVLGALFDDEFSIIQRKKKSTKAYDGTEKILDQISKVISKLMETAESADMEVVAIGAGVPGVIKDGVVLFTPNLPWKQYPLSYEIQNLFKLPVIIDNDANVSLLGEWGHGVAKDTVNTVGFFVGTGVGGGLILNSKVYTGNSGLAGEIGHITLNPDGVICGCGSRGCLESYSSKTGILKYIQSQIRHGRECILKEELAEDKADYILRSSTINEAIEKGDKCMKEALEIAAKYLGIAVASTLNILNPEMVVFGGGLVEALGYNFVEKIKAYVTLYSVPHAMDNCSFQVSQLGDDACLYGALTLVEKLMENLEEE
ncbi:MAG: ROK family protein [bacterium]